MKFTVSTKPLIDALNLGVINQNVSKYYQKSVLAQVSANKNTLTVNLEASNVVSELILKGSADVQDAECTLFVDSVLLKQLVSTFEASVTTLEFTEGGLILHSGKSKFTLPKLLDEAELELRAPSREVDGSAAVIDIDKSDWKFIRDYQMYAIAMSFIHPVYTRIWVGEAGQVMVGDFDNSLFTYSNKSKLGKTCLLSDTIVNLFNSLPDGAKLMQLTDSYLITVKTDGFEYAAEFTPTYETDEGVGSYNSDIILDMMHKNVEESVKINTVAVAKFLNQAALLSSNTEDTIEFKYNDDEITLKDSNVDCKLPVEKAVATVQLSSYSVNFKTSLLKSVLSNLDEETVSVAPMTQVDPETNQSLVAGIIVWTTNMTAILAGVDE